MRKASKIIWTTSSSIIIKKLERQTLIDYCYVINPNVHLELLICNPSPQMSNLPRIIIMKQKKPSKQQEQPPYKSSRHKNGSVLKPCGYVMLIRES